MTTMRERTGGGSMPGFSRMFRSRWWIPAFSLFLGALILGAFALGDDLQSGLYAFGVMAVLAAVFTFGGRSETVRGLGGPGQDERWHAIDLRATALAGTVVMAVMIGAWLYAITQGEDGSPYTQLLALSGLAYVVGVAIGRWRS